MYIKQFSVQTGLYQRICDCNNEINRDFIPNVKMVVYSFLDCVKHSFTLIHLADTFIQSLLQGSDNTKASVR